MKDRTVFNLGYIRKFIPKRDEEGTPESLPFEISDEHVVKKMVFRREGKPDLRLEWDLEPKKPGPNPDRRDLGVHSVKLSMDSPEGRIMVRYHEDREMMYVGDDFSFVQKYPDGENCVFFSDSVKSKNGTDATDFFDTARKFFMYAEQKYLGLSPSLTLNLNPR